MMIANTTTRFRTLAATTAVGIALLMSVPSFADDTTDQAQTPAATPAPAAAQATTPGDAHVAKVEARIKSLHHQLHITAAQEQQWTTVAQVMRDNASEVGQLVSDRNSNSGMTAVDDLRSYEAITDAHADGLKKLIPAFEALYTSMSDSQKKTADILFRHVRQPVAHKA